MFYETLKNLCDEHKTTPTTVMKSLGFSTSMLTNWKKGGMPRGDTLQKFADYFEVTTDYLLGKESHKKSPSIPTGKKGVRIPVLGSVAAGIPLEAISDIEDYEEISEAMAAGGEYVALRIHGDSMEPRMTEGDVVIVRVQDTAESGDIAIVIVNGGEATCKKIKKTSEGLILIALNPDYEPMFFSRKEIEELPVRIFGKVVELRAKFW